MGGELVPLRQRQTNVSGRIARKAAYGVCALDHKGITLNSLREIDESASADRIASIRLQIANLRPVVGSQRVVRKAELFRHVTSKRTRTTVQTWSLKANIGNYQTTGVADTVLHSPRFAGLELRRGTFWGCPFCSPAQVG